MKRVRIHLKNNKKVNGNDLMNYIQVYELFQHLKNECERLRVTSFQEGLNQQG